MWLSEKLEYSIRGGLISNFYFVISVLIISIVAVILIFKSNLSLWLKFGLSIPQCLGILPLTLFIIQSLIVIFIFGAGCRTDFVSPSGNKSIAISETCFMDCHHTVFRHYWILEKKIGSISSNADRVCKTENDFQITWNSNETAIKWQDNNLLEGSLVID
ncbi:hypothetical protein H6G75_07130 [Nostoc sp. FACHB-280]|nr:hypothetical protein [Nostoc sp. FACHB-280]